jgi:hypothetical protein
MQIQGKKWIVRCLALAFGVSTAGATEILRDTFDNGSLPDFAVTSNSDGTVSVSGGKVRFSAAGNNDLGFGSFGMIATPGIQPTAAEPTYAYLWGWEFNSSPIPQRFLFGLTDGQTTLATAANQIPFGMLGTSGQVQEALFRSSDGIDVNLQLQAGSPQNGPFNQSTTPYDFRFVMQDVGSDTTIDLDFKESSSSTWIQFINSSEGICCDYPADTATLYLSLSARERTSDGTDLFIDEIHITTQDLTAPIPEPAAGLLLALGALVAGCRGLRRRSLR